ncbi:hypothetical protein ABGB16_21525 [Micromonospora sp. B11E3]|uniref:hypothetical protein n=1 Tax=Micromonospora sp. B11E3 TaxID=3153562 RepID=UPI00325C5902
MAAAQDLVTADGGDDLGRCGEGLLADVVGPVGRQRPVVLDADGWLPPTKPDDDLLVNASACCAVGACLHQGGVLAASERDPVAGRARVRRADDVHWDGGQERGFRVAAEGGQACQGGPVERDIVRDDLPNSVVVLGSQVPDQQLGFDTVGFGEAPQVGGHEFAGHRREPDR